MGLIAQLAALLGLEAGSVVARAKSAAIIYGLMAVSITTAIGFLVAAGYMVLADLLSPLIAALVCAGIFLLLALAVYLGTLIGRQKRAREITEKRRSSETGAFLTTAAVTALPMLLKSPMLLRFGIPAALAALFVLRGGRDD